MERVDRRAYLDYSFALKPEERRIMSEMSAWLPDEIVDAHAHCNCAKHVLLLDDTTYHHMASTFPYFDLEESSELHQMIFPEKGVRTLRFALPYMGIDHEVANDYLLSCSAPEDRIALYGPPCAVEYISRMLSHPRVSALKMYYKSVVPWATRIYDYFPREVLAIAQERGVPIVLNLPTIITKCGADLRQMISDFPRLRIAIAHLGSSKFIVPGLREEYEAIATYPNVFMDTAMNPCADVVKLAIEVLGENRVMYGSDEPICLVRSVPYVHPTRGQRIVTEYPYHWVDPVEHEEFKHLAVNAIHTIWQSLIAIRVAIASYPKNRQEPMKEKVFCANASDFYGFS